MANNGQYESEHVEAYLAANALIYMFCIQSYIIIAIYYDINGLHIAAE